MEWGIPTSTCAAGAVAGVAIIAWIRTRARLRGLMSSLLDEACFRPRTSAAPPASNPCVEITAYHVRPSLPVLETSWPDLLLSARRIVEGVPPANERQAMIDGMMTLTEATSLLEFTRKSAEGVVLRLPDTLEED